MGTTKRRGTHNARPSLTRPIVGVFSTWYIYHVICPEEPPTCSLPIQMGHDERGQVTFGVGVARARAHRGWSQQELAARLDELLPAAPGRSRQPRPWLRIEVLRTEAGRRNHTASTQALWAEALGCPVSRIWELGEDPNPQPLEEGVPLEGC